MTRTASRALAVSRPLLIGLSVLNLLYALCISVLLIASFVYAERLWTALGFDLATAGHRDTVAGLRAIVVLGLVGAAIVHGILRRLREIVASVLAGDPFISENARRLEAIAWSVLAIEALRLLIHGIARLTYALDRPLELGDGFSFAPWLAVLLLFVLAGVFTQGTRMRADLEGTV